jgi:hypothetical protein
MQVAGFHHVAVFWLRCELHTVASGVFPVHALMEKILRSPMQLQSARAQNVTQVPWSQPW